MQASIKFTGGARKHAAETRGVVFIAIVCLDVTAGSVFDAQRAPLSQRGVERHAVFSCSSYMCLCVCVCDDIEAGGYAGAVQFLGFLFFF